jgi:hypothetical protein
LGWLCKDRQGKGIQQLKGYFVDKLNFAKQEMEVLEEQEAALLLSQIVAIIKKDGRKKGGKRVEMESYSDYPQAVRNNAKRGIELNEKQRQQVCYACWQGACAATCTRQARKRRDHHSYALVPIKSRRILR